ncbi:putative phosphoribosyl transferase [Amycolatopsis lexingtonensis]|uniref:Phosphoribosyl transferase n=1 Tax=Amycolatopsis lexingtonensis TaxID=218822 RepID=A0ABR9HSV2_9PSEU|nr:phosphoribosyltransferase [Amycolatopsis lexingtonensis]MBE1494007.1 putative phosphoribosyl transferase [Amycolatopsis lexingtonensis]
MRFADRAAAGHRLAERLTRFRDENPVVTGLPRGGVPVAFAVARALRAPLDVIVVRKLGLPWRPELAFGALGEDEVRVIDENMVRRTGLTTDQIAAVTETEGAELRRRVSRLRSGRERIPLADRTVIVVDDGVATGATARAACRVAKAQGAARVVLAVPVATRDAAADLRASADDVVCLRTPADFRAVGQWYRDFRPTSDAEVGDLLRRAAEDRRPPPAPLLRDDEVALRSAGAVLPGHLTLPGGPTGLVVFAHGSGSSRHSPRNRHVAAVLNRAGLGTLLFDLLAPAEEADRTKVFDIPLLAGRLAEATNWLRTQPGTTGLPVGYFGASTGAAAALVAAAGADVDVRAIVSRGGRPDLAGAALHRVRAPTLLIVGGADDVVLRLNRRARAAMPGETCLAVVPGATHLFEEPGALDQVAYLARDWFTTRLGRGPRTPAPALAESGPGEGKEGPDGRSPHSGSAS